MDYKSTLIFTIFFIILTLAGSWIAFKGKRQLDQIQDSIQKIVIEEPVQEINAEADPIECEEN